jgi:hypothetical protein
MDNQLALRRNLGTLSVLVTRSIRFLLFYFSGPLFCTRLSDYAGKQHKQHTNRHSCILHVSVTTASREPSSDIQSGIMVLSFS